jgi:hypothetical protein
LLVVVVVVDDVAVIKAGTIEQNDENDQI